MRLPHFYYLGFGVVNHFTHFEHLNSSLGFIRHFIQFIRNFNFAGLGFIHHLIKSIRNSRPATIVVLLFTCVIPILDSNLVVARLPLY